MPKTCPECGGNISLAPNERIERYKGLALHIPSVRVPTCERCNEQFISPQVAEQMQRALELEYQEALFREFSQALEQLKDVDSVEAIGRMLGYSQGYLSKLSRRERNLTTPTVMLMKLLARDPEQRLRELSDFQASATTSTSSQDNPVSA